MWGGGGGVMGRGRIDRPVRFLNVALVTPLGIDSDQ